MSLVEFDDIPITKLDIVLPRHGAWYATMVFPGVGIAPDVGEQSTLKVAGSRYVGTVASRTVVSPGEVVCRIVGGAGEMSSVPRSATHHVEAPIKNILNAVLYGSGEVLAVLPTSMKTSKLRWEVTPGVPRGRQVSKLIKKFGDYVWRVNGSGEISIVNDVGTAFVVPPKSTLEASTADASRTYRLFDDSAVIPSPGTSHPNGGLVEEVNVVLDGSLTVTVSNIDIVSAIDAVASRTENNQFRSCYPASVVGQSGDGTLEVNPDDPRIAGRGMSKVKVRSFVGATLEVPTGTRCFVQFDNDDPSRPFVSGFEQWQGGSSNNLSVKIGNSTRPVALGDIVDTLLGELKSYINNHTHPTPSGPSSPPTFLLGAVPPGTDKNWGPLNITSTKSNVLEAESEETPL